MVKSKTLTTAKIKKKSSKVLKKNSLKASKAKAQKASERETADSYLEDLDRIEVIHTGRPAKNMVVRDIGPTIKIEDNYDQTEESPAESFKKHQLTPEDMPQVESPSKTEHFPVDFKVEHLDDNPPQFRPVRSSARDEDAAIEAVTDKIMQEVIPKDTVRVRFAKFVNLVSSRDFKDVVEQNANEEIVMSSNLLTELAGAQDRVEERKMPLVFLVGIAIGIVLTYIFFST